MRKECRHFLQRHDCVTDFINQSDSDFWTDLQNVAEEIARLLGRTTEGALMREFSAFTPAATKTYFKNKELKNAATQTDPALECHQTNIVTQTDPASECHQTNIAIQTDPALQCHQTNVTTHCQTNRSSRSKVGTQSRRVQRQDAATKMEVKEGGTRSESTRRTIKDRRCTRSRDHSNAVATATGSSPDLPRKCWNCGTVHRYTMCRRPRKLFCFGCGNGGVTIQTCDRCNPTYKVKAPLQGIPRPRDLQPGGVKRQSLDRDHPYRRRRK